MSKCEWFLPSSSVRACWTQWASWWNTQTALKRLFATLCIWSCFDLSACTARVVEPQLWSLCTISVDKFRDEKLSLNRALLSHLILVNFTILQFSLALLLKCNDNQGHENVNEEEWKHYEINDVEYGHLDTKVLNWTPVLICCGHWVLKYSGKIKRQWNKNRIK